MSFHSLHTYFLAHEKNHVHIINECKKINLALSYEIFSSAFECVKKIYQFEVDLIFIEESLFDKFYNNLSTFNSREWCFTFKRCVVFSLERPITESRLLELSLFNIRSAFHGDTKFANQLKNNFKQILNFQNSHPKISLCLSGGGIDGYMYSLGVCHGFEKCLENFEMRDCSLFCGVSSGAILASCYAGGVKTADLIQQAYKQHPELEPMGLCTLFDLALVDSIKEIFNKKVPLAFFKGKNLKNYFNRQINYFGMEDDLSSLKKDVYIFATDQDTGKIVVFGKDPWKKSIKISQAIRASSALPPFYLPEKINGHWFTDGQLATSIELDLPIHEKSSLIFLIDPIVGFSTTQAGGVKNRGGFFTSLQAIKRLLQSRSEIALQHARDKYPDVDFIRTQPSHDVMELMSGNPMRIPVQTKLIQLSALAICEQILNQYDYYKHIFAKHGLVLKSQSAIKNENI